MVVAGKNQNNAATSGTRYVTRRSLAHDVIALSGRLFEWVGRGDAFIVKFH